MLKQLSLSLAALALLVSCSISEERITESFSKNDFISAIRASRCSGVNCFIARKQLFQQVSTRYLSCWGNGVSIRHELHLSSARISDPTTRHSPRTVNSG